MSKLKNGTISRTTLFLLLVAVIFLSTWLNRPVHDSSENYVVFGAFCSGECAENTLYKTTGSKSFEVVNSIGEPKGRTDFELQKLSEDKHNKMDGIMDLVKNEWGKDYLIKYRQATKDGWSPDPNIQTIDDEGGVYVEYNGEYTYLPAPFASERASNNNIPIDLKPYDTEVTKLNDYISKKMNSLSR